MNKELVPGRAKVYVSAVAVMIYHYLCSISAIYIIKLYIGLCVCVCVRYKEHGLYFLILNFIYFFCWSIVDIYILLVSSVHQSDSVTYILFQTLFLYRLLQNIEYSSLCYTIGPCWLSTLYMKGRKKVQVTQLCLTLCHPMDYTVHGIFQARILEWIALYI